MTAISSNPLWQHYRIVLILRDELMKKIRNPNKKQSQRDKLTQKTLRILQVPTKCETQLSFSCIPSFIFLLFRQLSGLAIQNCVFSSTAVRLWWERQLKTSFTGSFCLILPSWQKTGCEIVNLQHKCCKYGLTPGRQKHNFLPLIFLPLSFV